MPRTKKESSVISFRSMREREIKLGMMGRERDDPVKEVSHQEIISSGTKQSCVLDLFKSCTLMI